MKSTYVISLAAAALVLSACSSGDSSSPAPEAITPQATESVEESATETATEVSGITVLATTSVIGDVTRQIVDCGGGTVDVLMPIGTDAHDFSASSEQVAAMVNSDLVVAVGLGLEAGLTDSFENAASDGARIFELAPQLDPIEFGAGGHSDEEGHSDEDGHSDEEGDVHGSQDPHFWFDMNRMATAAELIGAELTTITGDAAYTTCAGTTAGELRAAEGEVRALLESVPADKRILVTDHDALGYLADTYGYEVAGTVIPSGSTLAEPSSADLAELVATIKAEGITTIFANVTQPSALAEAVAAEIGSDVQVVPLYVESLGAPDSPAATYIDMMRTNATLISSGLQG